MTMNALQVIRSTLASHFRDPVQLAHRGERGHRRYDVGADQLVRVQVEGDRFESRTVLDISLNGLSVVGRVRTLPRDRRPLILRLHVLGVSCPIAFRIVHVSDTRSGLGFVHDQYSSLPFLERHLALFEAGALLRVGDASILRVALQRDGIFAVRAPGHVDLTIEPGEGRWMATVRRGKDWIVVRRCGSDWITGRTPVNGGVFSKFVPDPKVSLGAIRMLALVLVGAEDAKVVRLTRPLLEQCISCIIDQA
jgi:hypothetical protein